MEEEDIGFKSFMWDDRENDLEEFDLKEFVYEEGVTYMDYLERQKVKRRSELRSERISVVTTPEIATAIRLIAAAERKTVCTFLNDLIRQSLAGKIKLVMQYLSEDNQHNDV